MNLLTNYAKMAPNDLNMHTINDKIQEKIKVLDKDNPVITPFMVVCL